MFAFLPQSVLLYQSAQPSPDLQAPSVDPTQHHSHFVLAPQARPSLQKPSDFLRQSPAQRTQRPPAPSSAPLIRYQCGDCSCLFESLGQWQQHRKLGQCTRPEAETAAEGEVKMEEQLDEGGEEQLDQTEGSAIDGVREDEGGEERGGGGGACQNDCVWNERAVSQDHAYLPYAGEKQEEEEGGESTANQARDEESMGEPGTMGVQSSSENQPTDLQTAQADGEGECEAADHSFLCVCCGSGFSSEPALVAHRRSRHGLEEALHHCPVCGESFMNTTLFLYHRRQHREKEEGSGAVARPGDGVRSVKRPVGLLPSSAPTGGAKRKSCSVANQSRKGAAGKDQSAVGEKSPELLLLPKLFLFLFPNPVLWYRRNSFFVEH